MLSQFLGGKNYHMHPAYQKPAKLFPAQLMF